MPRFPPTLRGLWGDTAGYVGNMTTNVEFDCVDGDLIVIYFGTSDYLHRAQGAPVWQVGAGEGFQERGAVYGISGWTNVYTWTARATWTGHAKVAVTVSGGNANANSSAIRAQVWAGSDGVGAQHALRLASGGIPNIPLTTQQDQSAIAVVIGDWNGNDGSPAPLGGTNQDYFINHGYAEWFFGYAPNAGAPGGKSVGLSSPTNWKPSMAVVEILGQFRDTTLPSAVSSISATVLSATDVRVDWGAASDDVGVTRYRVFDYTTQIADLDANARTFTHGGLAGSSTHQYTVRAVDAAGNMGGVLESKTVTTQTAVPAVNKAFLGVNKPTLRVGTSLVSKLYQGDTQVWP